MKSTACGLLGGGWFWTLRAIETGSYWLALGSAIFIGIAVAIFTTERSEETR